MILYDDAILNGIILNERRKLSEGRRAYNKDGAICRKTLVVDEVVKMVKMSNSKKQWGQKYCGTIIETLQRVFHFRLQRNEDMFQQDLVL